MKTLFILLFSCMVFQLKAQTFKEFFRQKKTQKEYLLKQIAALKIYGSYLKEGYGIASFGLSSIHNFRNGEFNLHQDYFSSLQNVNPIIANNPKIKQVVDWKDTILKCLSNISKGNLNDSDWRYIQNVARIVLNECRIALEDLKLLLQSSRLAMSDEERLSRINKLHQEMQSRMECTKSFVSDIHLLQSQNAKEIRENKTSLKWFNLQNK